MKSIYLFAIAFTFFSCGTSEKEVLEGDNLKENKESTSEYIDLSTLSEDMFILHLNKIETQLIDPKTNETSRPNAIKMLEASNNFAERFPESDKRESVMYKGALAARGLDKHFEAVRILHELGNEYGESERYPDYAYEEAFIYDDIIGDKQKAKTIYEQLAKDFPEHPFGKDSEARLKIIDMTDEELMEYFSNQNGK